MFVCGTKELVKFGPPTITKMNSIRYCIHSHEVTKHCGAIVKSVRNIWISWNSKNGKCFNHKRINLFRPGDAYVNKVIIPFSLLFCFVKYLIFQSFYQCFKMDILLHPPDAKRVAFLKKPYSRCQHFCSDLNILKISLLARIFSIYSFQFTVYSKQMLLPSPSIKW